MPTFPENLIQIHLEVFAQVANRYTNRQANTQTNNDKNITSLAEVVTLIRKTVHSPSSAVVLYELTNSTKSANLYIMLCSTELVNW